MGPEQMNEEDKAAKIAELEGEPSTLAPATQEPVNDVQAENAEPVVPSQFNSATPPTASKTRFKFSKKLVIIIVGAILLLSGGSAWAYVALVYQNPTNVVFDAVSNYFKASNVNTKTVIKTTSPISLGDRKMNVRLEFDSAETNAPSFEGKVKLIQGVDDKSIEIRAEIRLVESGSLYFRIDDLDKAMKDAEEILGTAVPAEYTDIINKIQNKWVEVSADNLKDISAETSKTYQCIVDAMKKYKDDQSMLDVYRKHPFVNIKDSLGVKDGNTGYKVELDKGIYKEFSKALEGTPFQKDINACYGEEESPESSVDALADSLPDDIDLSVNLWVSQWTHQLNRAEMTIKINGGDSGIDYAIDGTTEFTYGASIQPATAPADAVSIYDWIMDIFGPAYAGIQDRATATSLSSSANMVKKKAEAYHAITAQYPANVAAFAEYPETKIDGGISVTGGLMMSVDVVTYKKCAVGAQVAYYDPVSSAHRIINVGDANYTSQTSLCK